MTRHADRRAEFSELIDEDVIGCRAETLREELSARKWFPRPAMNPPPTVGFITPVVTTLRSPAHPSFQLTHTNSHESNFFPIQPRHTLCHSSRAAQLKS